MFLLNGLQFTLRPPNKNMVVSDTAVSVCHDLPTGTADNGLLQNKTRSLNMATLYMHLKHVFFLIHGCCI